MTTEDQAYSEYLENKYLPGRRFYLNRIVYPKLVRRFDTRDTIIDLGCGNGEFLNFCREHNRSAVGVDSNEVFAKRCQSDGLQVVIDSVCKLTTLKDQQFKFAICDNVLEHLEQPELEQFFERMQTLLGPDGILVCVVPGIKGFQKDPTHKTYITYELLNGLLEKGNLKVSARYHHPINVGGVHKYLYLNMQVFEIRRR